jgi:hypothetical protein
MNFDKGSAIVYMLFWLFLQLSCCVFGQKLFFASPEYSIQNPNFTIGALFRLVNNDGSPDYFGISDALTMFCSLQNYANGKGQIPVRGTFNLFANQEKYELENKVYTFVRRLEAQDLFYTRNGSQFGPVPDTPIGTIFMGTGLSESNYYYSQVSFFPIPLITHVSIPDYSEGGDFMKYLIEENFELQVASGPVSLLLSSAIGSVMLAFNWTLAGLMYSDDPFGLAGEASVIDLLAFTQTLAVECSQMYLNSSSISKFSSCIKNSRKTRFIALWMPLNTAAQVAQEIIDETGLEGELVFILPFVRQENIKTLKFPTMTFFFTALVYETDSSFNLQCLSYIQEKAGRDYLPSTLLEEYFFDRFNCHVTDSSLPPCPEDYSQRTEPCSCSGNEAVCSFHSEVAGKCVCIYFEF